MSLPSGYTRLEYVESNGTQYIDTGFKADVNARLVIDAQVFPDQPENYDDTWMLFGTFDDSGFGALYIPASKKYMILRDYDITSFSADCKGNERLLIDYNKTQASIKINGIEEQIELENVTSLPVDGNIFIFAGCSWGDPFAYTAMKVYSCQIYDNDVLIRDFVPCLAPSGTAGLYDLANGVFYGAAAGDPLIAGIPLPSGYREVEYIESTGTQYINTGISVPHASCKIILEFAPMEVSADNPFAGYAYPSWNWNTNLAFVSASKILVSAVYGPTVQRDVFCKFEYTSTYYRMNDGDAVSTSAGNYTDGYNNTLSYASGKYGKNKIKSYRLYNGDTVVRDFIPCIDPSGVVGMWDTVNGVFYGNAGTGSFAAGPMLIVIPDPPGNLTAESNNGTNTLTWDESAYADGYRVYENGVLIADTQQTSLTAVSEPYSANIYSVTAYNGDGESEPAVIRVYTSGSRDVLDDLITDRTLLDVTKRTKKGVYNAHDINRVSTAAHRVRTVLAPLGYLTPEVSEYRWAVNEIPKSEEMAAHHASVIGQDVINYSKTKIDLPVSLSHLTHEGANNIEKFLRLCGEAAERIPDAYIYSGEIFGGEG